VARVHREPYFKVASTFLFSVRTGNRELSNFSINSLFAWLVADGWYWFVLREKYY
jgi:hypothetical protein